MLAAVTTGITTVLGWIGEVVEALVTGGSTPGALNGLLPLFAIGIAISAILLGELIAQFKALEFGKPLFKTIPSEALLGNV